MRPSGKKTHGAGGSTRFTESSRTNSHANSRPSGKSTGKSGAKPAKARTKPRAQSAANVTSTRDLIEGRRAVAEALALHVPLVRAYVARTDRAHTQQSDASFTDLIDQLKAADVPMTQLDKTELDRLSSHGAHQGIMVEAASFRYAELSDILNRVETEQVKSPQSSSRALVLVLDHVTDEGNFGAIVRSAEVVGAAGVIIPKARSARVGVGAYKTSAGAVLHMPIVQVANISRTLDELKAAGFWVCAASEHAKQTLWQAPMSGLLAIVMGSEGDGISDLVQKHCDFSCKLPQVGNIESLNVAQAATVMCYEWLRQSTQQASSKQPHSKQ